MKNYGKILPIIMVVVMGLSFYKLISDSASVNKEYNKYLKEARAYAADTVTKYAIQNYEMALEIKSTPELYAEVAKYYKDVDLQNERMNWCDEFLEEYPTSTKAYETILSAYYDNGDYEYCVDLLNTAEKRNVKSDYITKISDKLAYLYDLDYGYFDDATVYSNCFTPVESDELWGYVNRYGKTIIKCNLKEAYPFYSDGIAGVVNGKGEAYFIDQEGDKVMAIKNGYVKAIAYVDDVIIAIDKDGKYDFTNKEFKKLFGGYDYATIINNDVAAVKNGDSWTLINEKGKAITDTKYSDVIIDEKNVACRNERLFVKSGDSYIMVDTKGKQVGTLKFEDAKVFAVADSYAAVKIDGRWCFIDKDGKKLSDKTYADARSFSNGLAAVKVSGKWGFIDESGKLVIANEFDGAKDFSEKGSCFVKVGDSWQVLKIYRLNQEG